MLGRCVHLALRTPLERLREETTLRAVHCRKEGEGGNFSAQISPASHFPLATFHPMGRNPLYFQPLAATQEASSDAPQCGISSKSRMTIGPIVEKAKAMQAQGSNLNFSSLRELSKGSGHDLRRCSKIAFNTLALRTGIVYTLF